MPKYRVTHTEQITRVFEVEAANMSAAEELVQPAEIRSPEYAGTKLIQAFGMATKFSHPYDVDELHRMNLADHESPPAYRNLMELPPHD